MLVYAGEDASVPFEFKVDGEFVVPSAVVYTVRGNDGQPISVLTDHNIPVDESMTETTVVVPANHNVIGAGRDFETRTVSLRFIYNGVTYRAEKRYRVVPFLNHSVSPDDVRSAIGTMAHEFQDAEIDIMVAYLQVRDRVGDAVLTQALSAGSLQTMKANDAIKFRAALNLIPSLQLRVMRSQGDDAVKFQRHQVDFEKLERSLVDQYEMAISALLPLEQSTVPLIVVTQPTDAVTGE